MTALELTLGTAKNAAVGGVIVLAVLALVVASIIRNITAKLLTIALVVAAGALVWSQRSGLQDCAAQFRDRTAAGDRGAVICRFFGKAVTVPTA